MEVPRLRVRLDRSGWYQPSAGDPQPPHATLWDMKTVYIQNQASSGWRLHVLPLCLSKMWTRRLSLSGGAWHDPCLNCGWEALNSSSGIIWWQLGTCHHRALNSPPLSWVADSFTSSLEHSCYYRYQNPVLPMVGSTSSGGQGGQQDSTQCKHLGGLQSLKI